MIKEGLGGAPRSVAAVLTGQALWLCAQMRNVKMSRGFVFSLSVRSRTAGLTESVRALMKVGWLGLA